MNLATYQDGVYRRFHFARAAIAGRVVNARIVIPAIAITTTIANVDVSARVKPLVHDMMEGIQTRIVAFEHPPETLVLERQVDEAWHDDDPSEVSLASAAAAMSPSTWREYLEYVPLAERTFLGRFRAGRFAALQVLARCPDLMTNLFEAPVLAAFLSAHQSLRGTSSRRWSEINAVHERGGLFGVLEWLGLPASRQTLAILRQIADPDLPIRLIEPLRASLWEPEIIWDLQRAGEITGRHLEHCCHALAA